MRRTLATVFSLFAAGVFLYSVGFVYKAHYGVPEGLTGARSAVALPGRGQVKAVGGFIRRVDGRRLELRSLAPNSTWTFRNRSGEDSPFRIRAGNVKRSALRVALADPEAPVDTGPVAFESSGPGAVEFELVLPPRSRRVLTFEQTPQAAGEVRFFVFGHARNGLYFLDAMQQKANEELPDFIIALGDNYYRSFPHKILDFDERLARSRVPVYVLPGEIEYREQDEPSPADSHPLAEFHKVRRHETMFGSGNHAFEYGGWRFITVDNARDRNIQSLMWLQGLRPFESGTPRTLFFSHIPPYDPRDRVIKEVTTGTESEHEMIVDQMQRLDVAAAFFDHYRWFDAGRVEGVPTYVTSISVSSRAPGQFAHFLDVTLHEGEIRVIQRPFNSAPPKDVSMSPDDPKVSNTAEGGPS